MPRLKPFSSYLPDSRYLQELLAPPYDVIDENEARSMVKAKGQNSFLRITRSEVDFPEGTHPYSREVYEKAKANLEEFLSRKLFYRDQESFYLYRLEWQGKSQTGIVGLTHIDDYIHDKIKKHELTRPEKELDRFHHIDILGFNTEPVFFTFRSEDSPELEEFINAYTESGKNILYDILDDDEVRHTVFRIHGEKEKQFLIKAFSELPCIYIADGHHRTASTVKAGLKRRETDSNPDLEKAYNYFLSVTFPSKQLRILPYNRLVLHHEPLKEQEILEKIAEKFIISEGKGILELHTFRMFLNGKWYHLRLKENFFRKDEVEDLDVSYLQDYILSPVFGIHDPRTSENIAFIGGKKGEAYLEELVVSGQGKVAFSLHPTPIESVFLIADRGKILPPKSTWFEPKLKSGFFLYSIEENEKNSR